MWPSTKRVRLCSEKTEKERTKADLTLSTGRVEIIQASIRQGGKKGTALSTWQKKRKKENTVM